MNRIPGSNRKTLLIVSITSTIIYLILLITNFIQSLGPIVWLPNVITIVLCGSCIVFALGRLQNITKIILLTVLPANIVYLTIMWGRMYSPEYYLIAIAFVPLLILKKTRVIMTVVFIYCALFIFCRLSYKFPLPLVPLFRWANNVVEFKIAHDIIIFVGAIFIIMVLQNNKNRMTATIEENHKMMKTLIGVLGHDLRAPIGLVRNLSDILMSRKRKEDGEYHRNIYKMASSASFILENILNWVVNQNDEVPLIENDINVNAVIQHELDNMNYLLIGNEKKVVFRKENPFNVKINGELLSIVLRNLTQNALRHSANDATITIDTGDTDKVIIRNPAKMAQYQKLSAILNQQNDFGQRDGTQHLGLTLSLYLCQRLRLHLSAEFIDDQILQVVVQFPDSHSKSN